MPPSTAGRPTTTFHQTTADANDMHAGKFASGSLAGTVAGTVAGSVAGSVADKGMRKGTLVGPHAPAQLGQHGRGALEKHLEAVREKLRRIAGAKKSDPK